MTGLRPGSTGAARPLPSRGQLPKHAPALGAPALGAHEFPVVGLGASAGGLDAFRKFFDVLPAKSGMAFVLIQHLDPTHASMMRDLLAGHTPMQVTAGRTLCIALFNFFRHFPPDTHNFFTAAGE